MFFFRPWKVNLFILILNNRLNIEIPVGVSLNGTDFVSKKNLTLEWLTKIKDICKNHRSDHYILTPNSINHLYIKIKGSTIEAYTPAKSQEICSFVEHVLSQD